jgi:probable HAF family extracellular repeat protein
MVAQISLHIYRDSPLHGGIGPSALNSVEKTLRCRLNAAANRRRLGGLIMKALILSLIFVGLADAAAAADYRVRTVDYPGAANTALYAINDFGQFVGAFRDQAGGHHAVIWVDGELRNLDPDGPVGTSAQSFALSINNHGDVAGAYNDASGASHGFVRYHDGSVRTIDFPHGFNSQAFGINDFGTVIGVYNDAAANPHAFLLREGEYKTIDLPNGIQTVPLSINDHEEIVGELIVTPNTNGYGYLQEPDGSFSLVTAPGSDPQQTYYISINNRDQILGVYANATVAQQNFLKTGSTFAPFDLPAQLGASLVSAQTVNDIDEIVGYYFDAAGVAHGFVARPVARRED